MNQHFIYNLNIEIISSDQEIALINAINPAFDIIQRIIFWFLLK